MDWIIPLHKIREKDRPRVGGKCFALAHLSRKGFKVPETVCLTTEAYETFLSATGLRERILLELNRKAFNDMRWEEIWDASLRIRNLFLTKPIPALLHDALHDFFQWHFEDKAVVVRSSAPEEDSSKASFAGLHESFINVRGTDSILKHVRLVWASLWSDAALLYRQELKLDIEKSAMAVVVQELIVGRCSGVAFSKNPNDPSQGVIESVYGLNQGLVDGAVEPDRWMIDRASKRIISHTPAHRDQLVVPGAEGVRFAPLPEGIIQNPPLNNREVFTIFDLALQAEERFKAPQDVEWTLKEDAPYVLQSRPITTVLGNESEDERRWYLSLHRSFENLKALRQKIEGELIPGMIEEASVLARQDLTRLSDGELALEIERRSNINDQWVSVYWTEFIPFAHGIRLFGQIYNDTVKPQNPYEFVELLGQTEMESLERNRMLEDMASVIRTNPSLREKLLNRDYSEVDRTFLDRVEEFVEKFGDLSCPVTGETQCTQGPEALIKIVLEMASHPPAKTRQDSQNVEELTERFLGCFEGEQRIQAAEILDLARTSYRLRDDDNIYLGRIEAQLLAANDEGKKRLEEQDLIQSDTAGAKALMKAVKNLSYQTKKAISDEEVKGGFNIKPRQLVGQPAGPGISKGSARVIQNPSDLPDFKHGEILVCDAVEPNMTFVVPLAAGVIERRGGMLIHGAIIAREYGIPCVTGIPKATSLIRTGNSLTVDGYLGIVTVG
jgi:pyruvate,water dikinase